jgi:hypothetical protein
MTSTAPFEAELVAVGAPPSRVSEFSAAFGRSFAIQRALSAAVARASLTGSLTRMSDVLKSLGYEQSDGDASDLVAMILQEAEAAGLSIAVTNGGDQLHRTAWPL